MFHYFRWEDERYDFYFFSLRIIKPQGVPGWFMVGNGKLAPLFLLRRVGGPVPELFARGEAFSVLDIFQSCAASQIKNEIEN